MITVDFSVEDLDSTITSSESSNISSSGSYDFNLTFTPQVLGNYLLYANISNSTAQLHELNTTLDVNGNYTFGIEGVSVKEVGG